MVHSSERHRQREADELVMMHAKYLTVSLIFGPPLFIFLMWSAANIVFALLGLIFPK